MGLIVDLISKFANSKTGVKLYKWAASEKGQKALATTIPTMESIVATSFYIASTECQKKLDRREKNVLQWQNVITGIIGVTLGTFLNKKVFTFGERIIKNLDPKKIPDPHKVMGAIRVATPIATTALLMRFALPVATAFISGEIEEHKSKKKLDIIA